MANLIITHFSGDKDYPLKSPLKKCRMMGITTARCFCVLENTTLLSLVSDEDVYIEFGIDPIATNKSRFLPSKKVEYFEIDLKVLPLLSVCDGFTDEYYSKITKSSKMWFEFESLENFK